MARFAPSPGSVLIRPLRDFFRAEAAGGVVLLLATAIGLGWANSPWGASYRELWSTEASLSLGHHALTLDLRHWVDDGLMAVFFFVVGLEIKRELVDGELRDRRRAVLPAVAALGGMVVPAVLYLAVNGSGAGRAGWGIPMATDIALALGVLALLGARVAPALTLFLLTLAIVDDIGAIVVIAVFYSDAIDLGMLAGAGAVLAGVLVMRALGIRSIAAYLVVGVLLWLLTHEAGIHATLAGVAMGLLMPARPWRARELIDADDLLDLTDVTSASETASLARDSVSVVEWLEHRLHPWTSFVVVPLFALANTGITVDRAALGAALGSPVSAGVVLGLVVGKPVVIVLGAWVASRSGIGALADGLTWRGITGVAALGGIGFTVALFVADQAFAAEALRAEATMGILAASVVSAIVGALILRRTPVGTIGHPGGPRDPGAP